MNTWPWTNQEKELAKRLKESQKINFKAYTVEEVFSYIRRQKGPSLYTKIIWKLNDWTWKIYRCFKPCNDHVRKAIPRESVWIGELLILTHFAMIKHFYENEMKSVEWFGYEGTFRLDCRLWLEKSYWYIVRDRLDLEEQLHKSYPEVSAKSVVKGTYEEKYAETLRLEQLIKQNDDEVLHGLIKYRSIL